MPLRVTAENKLRAERGNSKWVRGRGKKGRVRCGLDGGGREEAGSSNSPAFFHPVL